MKYDYLIVGAGLFGAVFAHQAKCAGKSVLVIDKRDHIGGNIYTEDMEGIQVHKYGAHIFHTNSKHVWEYVNRFAEFNRYTNSPVANYIIISLLFMVTRLGLEPRTLCLMGVETGLEPIFHNCGLSN